MIPSGYNAELYYNDNGSTKSFPLVITSETSSLEAQVKSSATRKKMVYYPWLSMYNPTVKITAVFESQSERNRFSAFIRAWQKKTASGKLDTFTYRHKNWNGSNGHTQFECIVSSISVVVKYDAGVSSIDITLMRASDDGKQLNQGVTQSRANNSFMKKEPEVQKNDIINEIKTGMRFNNIPEL